MLAVALGLVVGIVIGGFGGGGGVLTVPLLVYVLGQSAQEATTGSVVIVGVTAAVGVLARRRGIAWRTGLALGAVGVPAAAVGTLLNQRVPEQALLLSFAALTVCAAAAMLLDAARPPAAPAAARVAVAAPAVPVLHTVVSGVVIGFLTGFLGVGGGFLLVPVLLLVLRIPMAPAVGTSLLVIAINSAAALATRAGAGGIDPAVVVPFTLAAVLGSLAGKLVADRLSGPTLARAFALLLLAVGAFVAVESLLVP